MLNAGKIMKPEIITKLLTVAIFLLASSTVYTAEDSHREQVETLFRLTQMEKKNEDSVDNVVQLQLRQNPQLAQHKKTMHTFFDRHIGWNALKEDIAEMYMRKFSEKELQEINAFYITPAGQKVITVLPELVKERNQLAMSRLQQNIGELQQIIGTQKTTP